MTNNFIFCAFAVFFMVFGCSGSRSSYDKASGIVTNDPNDPYNPGNPNDPGDLQNYDPSNSFNPDSWNEIDGFFPHKDYGYGFDRHPSPVTKEDSIVYALAIKGIGYSVIFNLKVNKGVDYDYFICGLDKSKIEDIDDNKIKEANGLRYEYVPRTDNDKIALCRRTETGTEKMQELHIQQYNNIKIYDFDIYSFGDMNVNDDRHPFSNAFWTRFDSVFIQALVRSGTNLKYPLKHDRNYILTRTDGKYTSDCTKGNIDKAIDSMYDNANMDAFYHSGYGNRKRAVIQLGGYKTKRFWPIKLYDKDKIEICGTPNKTPPSSGLVLENVCAPIKDKLYASKDGNGWKVKYGDGKQYSNKDIKPECMVFAEDFTGDYIGEIGDGNAAVTLPSYAPDGSMGISVALLPNYEKNGYIPRRDAYHEIGHTMGLKDLYDIPLSCVPDLKLGMNNEGRYACVRTDQNNLMHYNGSSKEYRLRKRSIYKAYKEKEGEVENMQENQWNCLRRVETNKSCIMKDKVLLFD